jgi:hypothetical protein
MICIGCLAVANDYSELLSKSANDVAQEIRSIKSVFTTLTPDPREAQAKSKQFHDMLNFLLPLPAMSIKIAEVATTINCWDIKWQGKS